MSRRNPGPQQLALETSRGMSPFVEGAEAKRPNHLPDFSGLMRVIDNRPAPNPSDWGAHDEEVKRRNDREDRLEDEAGFSQHVAEVAAGTTVQGREFRELAHALQPGRPYTQRERRLGDVGTDFATR